MNKMKKSKIYAGILATVLSMPLSGCGNNVDCDIPYDHIHLYENDEGLSRLIIGEKEEKYGYSWTSNHVRETEASILAAKEGLLSTKDNIKYVLDNVNNLAEPYREEYVYDYIYGTYYGYGYCYHWDGDDWTWGYGYGNVTGWHWDYEWRRIDENTYTTNKVKDIKTVFKLYKLNDNGEFEYKYFDSFDEVEDGYIYFYKADLIVQVESDAYNLNPLDYQNKSLTK